MTFQCLNLDHQEDWDLVFELGPSTKIWGKWAKNVFLAITWQPLVRLSQAVSHFIHSFIINTLQFFFGKFILTWKLGPSL